MSRRQRSWPGWPSYLLTVGVMLIVQGTVYLAIGLVGLGHDPRFYSFGGAAFAVLGLLLVLIVRLRRSSPGAQAQGQPGPMERTRLLAAIALGYSLLTAVALIYVLVSNSADAGLQVVVYGSLALASVNQWLRIRRKAGYSDPPPHP